ncbi:MULTISPECIES: ABC transporter permease [unclassified Luteococcus]|uniref:ABC transporter permease n=1 Tax=unclassified Luteococcus TaxID=2639923 RepID=UPI00313AA0E0
MTGADDPARPDKLVRAARSVHTGGLFTALRGRIPTVIGMILLPLLIASTLLWSTAGAGGRVHRAEAAIVNLDQGATVGKEQVTLGQDYARHLRQQEAPNFSWRYGVSVEEAERGLASGQYSAAVIIPSGFSRVLTGTSAQGSAEKATLVVERSPVAGVSDQVVFGQLSDAATQSLSSSVTKKYLDNLFVTSAEVGSVLGGTSTLAQEAALAAGRIDRDAKGAQQSSRDLSKQASSASTVAKDAADSARRAATTAASAASPSAGPSAVSPAVGGDVAGARQRADELAKASTASQQAAEQAARQASDAAGKGAAVQGSSDAMARAAAANQAAASAYTGKVGQAVRQQAELQAQLGQLQRSLGSYVSNVRVVTDAVQQVSGRVDATEDGSGISVGQDSTGGTGPNRPRSAMLGPVRAQNVGARTLPQGPADDAAAQRDALVKALKTAAEQLATSGREMAPLRQHAEATVTAAEAVQTSYRQLVKDLPTTEVQENPGKGNGPEACRALSSPSERQACKVGYNAAVRQVNAALDTSRLAATAEVMVSQSKATRDGLAGLQNSSSTTAKELLEIARQLQGLTVVVTVDPTPSTQPTPSRSPDPSQTPSAESSSTPEPSRTPSAEPTAPPTDSAAPSAEPTPSATNTPSATDTPGTTPSSGSDQPSPTEQPSSTAGSSDQPSASTEPTSSDAPSASSQPSSTDSPSASTQPSDPASPGTDPSATATSSAQPTATDEPTSSATPSSTDQPVPTDQPSATDQPVPTDQPSATDQPSLPTQPEPTQTSEPDPGSGPEPTSAPGPDPADVPLPNVPDPTVPDPEQPTLVGPKPGTSPTSLSPAPGQNPPANAAVDSLRSQRVRAAMGQLNASSTTVQRQLDQLGKSLATGQQGLEGVASGSDAQRALSDGASSVTRASTAQASVVKQLTSSLDSLNKDMAGLGESLTGLQSGATSLSQEHTQLSDNATKLAGQVDSLNQTITGLQRTTQQVATDAGTAATRTAALQEQISALQQSSGIVDTRTSAIAEASGQQAKRADRVASQISQVQGQVPALDTEQRQKLSDVVSQPIDTSQSNAFRNIGWISMLMLLSLWIGAMGLHSTLNGISEQAKTSRASSRRVLLGEMGPSALVAVLQALTVSVAGQAALHLSAGRWAGVTGVLILASLAFATVNHALVAFLRAFGRLVAAACAVITGVTVLTQSHPAGMNLLLNISPVTPAVDAVRSVMTGGSFPGSFLGLLAWLVVGALFSALAILRARSPEPIRVPTIHDED